MSQREPDPLSHVGATRRLSLSSLLSPLTSDVKSTASSASTSVLRVDEDGVDGPVVEAPPPEGGPSETDEIGPAARGGAAGRRGARGAAAQGGARRRRPVV